MARGLAGVRERGGRLFILGVGGGAGHASHAVNDFRKLCGIESYAPTDNVSELTARTNDDGWETLVQRLAGGLAAVGSVTRCSSSPSVGARASTTSRRTSSVRWRPRTSSAPRSMGSLALPAARSPSWPTSPILIEPPPSCRRRWSSPSRPSCGTRWSPIRSWPLKQGHWESLAGSTGRERSAGRVPRSRRRAQRAGPGSRLGSARSRRCKLRTCACFQAPPRRRTRVARGRLRAGVRLQPAGGGEGQGLQSSSYTRCTSGCSSCCERGRPSRRLAPMPASSRGVVPSCRGRATAASRLRACC